MILTVSGCGDDVVVKPAGDALSGATDDVQVALDTADDATATAGDVATTGDTADGADAIAPSDAATPDAAGEDVAEDAAGSDAVAADDSANADVVTTPDDATAAADAQVDTPDEDASPDTAADDATVADTADADAFLADAVAADAEDGGADTGDGSLSDTWGPCSSGVTCEDGDPCTVDLCWNLSCQHVPIVACSGPLAPCDAAHPCAAGAGVCDLVRNACVPCTVAGDCGAGYACQQNACVPAVPCKSDLACKGSGQVCDKADGVCVACVVDGDCGKANRCVASQCEPAVPCASSKDCTSVCDFKGGFCVDCADAADCGSGQACSAWHKCVPLTCKATECQGGAAFACNPGGWSYGAGTGCDDGNPCTDNSCVGGGGCKQALNTAACDDKNACTTNDTCGSGLCAGAVQNCNDQNLCTADSCDPTQGCQHAAAIGPCDDGSACTLLDQCVSGTCTGKAISCEDNNVCTADSCDATIGCRNLPSDVTACDDGNACTSGTQCLDSICQGGTTVSCDDGNPCTWDGCDGQGGCTHGAGNEKTACNDGDPCTLLDACQTGACKGVAMDCNDVNDCTADSCSGGACKHVPIVGACDDLNGCTVNDVCIAGQCAPGKAVDCPVDSKGCGSGVCKSTGSQTWMCSVVAQPDGASCDADGNGCTVGDQCKSGACVVGTAKDCSAASSFDGCKIGTCESQSASQFTCVAVPIPVGTSCNADSSGCTAGDKCNATGVCVAGPQVDCSVDPASCTTGVCMPTGATSYTCIGGAAKTDGTTCNADNSGCTLDICKSGKCQVGGAPDCSAAADKCDAGVCQSTDPISHTCVASPIACDDGNVCTTDGCKLPDGCVWTANSLPCNDNNVCTLSDTCSSGKCGGGAAAICDDKNPCTTDSCDSIQGCIHTLLACDDGDPCTVDSCDPGKGCVHTALANCVTVGVPYVEPFNCGGGKGWTLGQTAEPGVGWAIDATPSAPGYLSPACSLNFNNGKDFQCIKPMDASAVSPVIATASLPTGSHLAMRFFSNGAYEGATYDKMTAEITTNSGANWTELLSVLSPAALAWTLQTIDLTPYVGKALQIRFRFWTYDCINNDTVGGFIDDFAVYTTNCSASSTASCDDKNLCTTDACSGLTGQCTFTANALSCSDANACTTGDACKAGVCVGTVSTCDDANACTLDACDATSGKCLHTAIGDGTACDDANPCTTQDACSGTTCVGGGGWCNDNNPCTFDICTNLNGAPSCSTKNFPDGTPCTDGNTCTAPDMCTAGTCAGADVCGYTTVYSESFACGGAKGWTLQGIGTTALAWAVDATPAIPGYYSPSCSLNFNDGKGYGATVPAVAFATSPSFALPAKASACKLSLYSWAEVGFFNSETRVVALLDGKTGLDLVTYGITPGTDANAWKPLQVDCLAALGHDVTVQFRFSDSAGPLPVQPVGAGWFVDDVLVVVGAP